MPAAEIKTTITDTRAIEVPVAADDKQTAALADFASECARLGYVLTGAASLQGGSQRDPYTVGVRLTFSRQA